MKKLLAILLTLALLLPLYGLAEETVPQATLTTITFRNFNGRALMAEMEEAAETAYRDLLDALRVEVYRQGFTSCELFLNDQSIVDYGVQTRGADVYISGDVLGGTVYLNLDEDMRHIAEILHQWNASQSIYADAGTELSAKEVSESIAQEYENVGALLAKITKNPLITGEMQPKDVANGLFEADWQQAATRLNKILKVTRVESVSNPPEGCESAKNILYFPLSNEQLVEVLCILLDTVEETPAVKAYVDLLNTYRQLVAFAQDQPVEDTDLQTWLRQQTLLVEDAQVAQYVDASMRLLRVVISYKVAPTHTPTLAQDTLLQSEVFGPLSLLVEVDDVAQLQAVVKALQGQLTATLHAEADDGPLAASLLPLLCEKAGRVLFNGYPTGVEVCDAMVHGGPWPVTTDARGTSVGSRAIERFLRPVCLQNAPAALLPPALQDANPLNLLRLVNGQWTREAISSSH